MSATKLMPRAAFLLVGFTSYAMADELSVEQVCAQVYCRAPVTISLRLDESTAMDYEVEGTPVAFKRDVNLFPGESVELSVTMEDGEIQALTYDPNVSPGKETISIRFSQDDDDPYGMMLVVENSFDKYIRYKAYVALPGQEGFVYTSSCPVGPGMSAYESWPRPISHIILTNVHFVEVTRDGDTVELSCE